MDEALRRTLSGNLYRVKGYVIVPYELEVKALDEEEAEDFVIEEISLEHDEKIVVEEVIIQEDE